jgi:hypothetical protein
MKRILNCYVLLATCFLLLFNACSRKDTGEIPLVTVTRGVFYIDLY